MPDTNRLNQEWQTVRSAMDETRSLWADSRATSIYERVLNPLASSSDELVNSLARQAELAKKAESLCRTIDQRLRPLQQQVETARRDLDRLDDLVERVLAQCDDTLARVAETRSSVDQTNGLLSQLRSFVL